MIKYVAILLLLAGCATKDPVISLIDSAQESIKTTQEEINRLEDILAPECKTDGVRALIRVINDRQLMQSEKLHSIETTYKTELELKDEQYEKLIYVIVVLLILLGFSVKKLFT